MNSNKRPVEKPAGTEPDKRLVKVARSYLQKELGDGTPLSIAEGGEKSSVRVNASDPLPHAPQHLLKILDSISIDYFADIVATIRDPLLVLDDDLQVLAANRSFYNTFKVKQKDTIGRQIYNLGNRQWDNPDLRHLLENILPAKTFFDDYEVEHDFPIIGKRSMLLNARRIPAPPEKSQWILLAFEDITERRRLEHILCDSEERFRLVFETANDYMLLIDKTSGRVLNSNRSARHMLGYSRQELLKMNLWELDILKDQQQFEQVSEELENEGAYQILDKTIHSRGGQFPATINFMDRTGVIQCNIRDFTARKQSEEALRDSLKKLQNSVEGTINTIALVVEARDPYIAGHQKQVAEISVAIAKELGLPKEQIQGIYFASLIHDLGKIRVPSEILSKPGKLTKLEFDIIKTHSKVGYELLKKVDFPWPIAETIYQHHERVNGSGYPRKLNGDRISIEAKIIGVADVIEAMSSHRPYRPALGVEAAVGEIKKNKGILYDLDIVEAFLKAIEKDKTLIHSP